MMASPHSSVASSTRDVSTRTSLSALQLGMGRAPSQVGNGLDHICAGLADHLPEAGVEVQAWTTETEANAKETPNHVRVFAPAAASLVRRLWAVRQGLRSDQALTDPDLVASHSALYTAPVLDLINDAPLVIHVHAPRAGALDTTKKTALHVRVKEWMKRRVYQRGDRFVVPSEAFRDMLAETYDVAPSRIEVVPEGVPVDRFVPAEARAETREYLGLPRNRPIVVTVRHLVQRMGLGPLIEAVDRLRHNEPDLLMLVAGRGPLADALKRQIQKRGLYRHIRLLGFVPDEDLPRLYRAADVSIVPRTAWEGFSLVAAESLAAGTPALVTPVGGLPEVVVPLSEALVLDDHTPTALAEGLEEVLRGTRPLPRPEACHQYARRRFDWPVIAAQTRDIYANVCS